MTLTGGKKLKLGRLYKKRKYIPQELLDRAVFMKETDLILRLVKRVSLEFCKLSLPNDSFLCSFIIMMLPIGEKVMNKFGAVLMLIGFNRGIFLNDEKVLKDPPCAHEDAVHTFFGRFWRRQQPKYPKVWASYALL